jgi:hypothetical protein
MQHGINSVIPFIQVDQDGVDVSYDSRDETIVHMSEGKLSYKNIDILVFCDDEHGTFIHAKYDHRYEGYQYIECDPIILCGIGKYGFCGNEWVGITDSDVKAFAEWLVKIDSPLKELADARPYNQGDAFFCGVDNAMKRYNTASETVLMSGLKSAFKDRNKKKR